MQEKQRPSRPDASLAAAFGSALVSLRFIVALLQVVNDMGSYDYFDRSNGQPAAIAALQHRHFLFLLLLVIVF